MLHHILLLYMFMCRKPLTKLSIIKIVILYKKNILKLKVTLSLTLHYN